MNDNDWRNGMLLWGAVLACAACATPNDQVGSACKDGVCTGALTTNGPVCLAAGSMQWDLTGWPPENWPVMDSDSPNIVCVPEPFHQGDDGKVDCEVTWWLPADPVLGAPARCSDLPFLTPGPDEGSCLVDQIAPPSGATSSDEGWYYDASDKGTCAGPAALHFTDRAIRPEGVTVTYGCRALLGLNATGDLEPVEADECTLPADSAKHANTVGDPCHPIVPEGGFAQSGVFIQTGASECGTGVCLVQYVDGDPSVPCDHADYLAGKCEPSKEVAKRIFCSCRCDAAPGEPDACECPDGFSCSRWPVIDNVSPGLNGSYCGRDAVFGARNGTLLF